MVIQVADKDKKTVKKILEDAGVGYVKLGRPTDERHILATLGGATYQFGIDTCATCGTKPPTCSTPNRA